MDYTPRYCLDGWSVSDAINLVGTYPVKLGTNNISWKQIAAVASFIGIVGGGAFAGGVRIIAAVIDGPTTVERLDALELHDSRKDERDSIARFWRQKHDVEQDSLIQICLHRKK